MLNKNLRVVFLILIVVISFGIIGVNANDLRNSIIPKVETISSIGADANQEMSVISKILNYIKESIFGLLSVISIGMFIYVGFNLVKAQGNPEEMTKAWKTLIHVIVGLFLVAVSWALVAMVSGLKI